MDLTVVKSSGSVLLDHVEKLYGNVMRKRYEMVMYYAVLRGEDRDVCGFEDLFEKIKPDFAMSRHKLIRSVLVRIVRFNDYKLLPQRGQQFRNGILTSREQLEGEYLDYVSQYERKLHRNGNLQRTAHNSVRTVARFLAHLQKNGGDSLGKVTKEHIDSYLYADGRLIRGYRTVRELLTFLMVMAPTIGEVESRRIIRLFPRLRKSYRPYPMLTGKERDRIRGVLLNDSITTVSLRDKALVTTAMYTALRTLDIALLRFEDVSFKKELITLVQHKTGNRITLPLLPPVGNAIYRYIKYERPQSEEPYLFLSSRGEPRHLTSSGIYSAAGKVYDAAGVRMERGKRGLHMLRHDMAARLAGSGQNAEMVRTILGHASRSTYERYLEASDEMLGRCGLSVERWPIPESIFSSSGEYKYKDIRI